MPRIVSRTDVNDLKKIFMGIMKKIINFDGYDFENFETRFEKHYHLSNKLGLQQLASTCDLHDYLKCNSQLEYINKLRRSLVKNENQNASLS
jgi:hypothetical protein